MEFKTMSVADLEARKAQISSMVDADDADLDALTEEVRAINAELEARKNAEAMKAEIRSLVADGVGEEKETIKTVEEREKTKMTLNEVRSLHEYNVAYANYIKTGSDAECRSVLTENAVTPDDGPVAVPTYVENKIRTYWEKNEILAHVRRTFANGNLKVSFEASASPAAFHAEGGADVTEEELILGIVELKPQTIKKWVGASTEAVEYGLGGEDFLDYIYDELNYQIALFIEAQVLAALASASPVNTASAAAVPQITEDLSLMTIVNALAELKGGLTDMVAVMNPRTYAAIRGLQFSAGYAVDPFEGLTVIKTDLMLDIADAETNSKPYMYVGDFKGVQVNFPAGDRYRILRDDYTLATKDIVRFIGHCPVAIGIVQPYAICAVLPKGE